MSYTVKISLDITDQNGSSFFSNTNVYSNMPIEGVLQIEKMGLAFLEQLRQLGEAQAAAKAAQPLTKS